MSLPSPLSVYVIIPVHNRRATTIACLERLAANGDLQNYSIVVVDDGSTDGTAAAIRSRYPSVTILSGDGNLWWTGAIAQGMQYACNQGAAWLIWLNDDCQLPAAALSDLIAWCQAHPGAIVGCQGMEANPPDRIAFGGKLKTWQGYRFITADPGQVIPCDLLSGNLVCIPRAVVERIGFPDPRLMPHYGGDSLFLLRAKKAGFSLFVDARHCLVNLPGEPSLYPQRWLLADGEPLRILKLVFTPQSGLSWRVWLRFNWEAYSLWGLVMFTKKYASIGLITLLRFLPLQFRQHGLLTLQQFLRVSLRSLHRT